MNESLFTFLSHICSDANTRAFHRHARVEIAGRTIALPFADDELYQKYFPALGHQQVESSNSPHLTVAICDNRSHPLSRDILKTVTDAFQTTETAEAPVIVHHRPKQILSCHFDCGTLAALYYYDYSSQRACAWVNSELVSGEPMSVSAPIRTVLSWFFEAEGFTLLHAGGVALKGSGGILFCGQSGSGKSSCSLISIDNEIEIAGDDSVLVEKSQSPTVHSLYCSARIAPADTSHYSFLRTAELRKTAIKSSFYLNERNGAATTSSFRLSALVFPHISTNESPDIEPQSKIESLRSLSASNLYHVPGRNISALFTDLSHLVSITPCFRLILGRDREGIRPIVQRLMATDVVSGT